MNGMDWIYGLTGVCAMVLLTFLIYALICAEEF